MTPQPVKARVLIVDDNAANRYAFQSVLDDDYTVYVAGSGRRALELARVEEFSVILLDVRMPEMDGFETAEALRKLEKVRYTPIIFTSAYDKTLAQLTRGYVSGATDYLFSPVEADLLKLKVATYVQIYLRNEALRLQIHQLNLTLQSLQTELARRDPLESGLKARIRELEEVIGELNRQTVGEMF
jgi:two-component system, sensor histidine kinase and response regulator